MKHSLVVILFSILVIVLATGPGRAADKKSEAAGEVLFAAKRLACAFTHGVVAGFSPRGSVSIKPPLNPNIPGLTISIVDRKAKRVMLEEDDLETPGVYMTGPEGLTAMARYPDGGVTLVTVYPLYSGASDNFLMVASHHGAATMPQMTQRYGLCRVAADAPPPAPTPPPAAKGHGEHK
ncbi:conserved hypothetical protein [Solidesulfovibrio fructosivorans JJ]]|uniref:Uncharacterized protein n=1 Tax=Solidesulfovibrio fructosivorans JJ] TaxID=596151 RepID=E1JX37_SOLFR|nr:hypothetical protein [Solidesulfovibrio fructosivorans]EFL51002.1 conserved hypothetical protein [Solidesulfovibrio fructosivorans JJ]]